MKKILLVGISLFAFSVFAEEEVEEIVVKGKVLYSDQVNALKTPVEIVNVPQAVSIVTDEDIRKQGIREIGDIVRYTPGVNTSQGEGHRDAVVFRGVRSTADFFQDGARDDVQYYRSLYNVEQVEVLRGPNALLFGRGGTGGPLLVPSPAAVADGPFPHGPAAGWASRRGRCPSGSVDSSGCPDRLIHRGSVPLDIHLVPDDCHADSSRGASSPRGGSEAVGRS